MRVAILYGTEQLAAAMVRADFALSVPHRRGVYRIEARHASGACRRWDLADRRDGPHALTGGQGQLFLGGDSNDSTGQFTEPRKLSETVRLGWARIFDLIPHWRDSFGLAGLGVLVAPAKEEIFRDCYPRPRAQHTVVDDFLTVFADRGVIFPKWLLWNRRELAYSRSDSHCRGGPGQLGPACGRSAHRIQGAPADRRPGRQDGAPCRQPRDVFPARGCGPAGL